MAEQERRLIFSPEAEDELLGAAIRYDGERPGLGREFLVAVDETTRAVSNLPGVGEIVDKNSSTRKLRVTGFPFAVVYHEAIDQIYVIAVAHERRRPGYWQSRA